MGTGPEGGPMPGVELSASACGGHVVLALHGDLDMPGAADAGAAVMALVVPDRCLIIDMSALDFIDRGSLDALLRVQWLAWSTGGDVVLAAPQRHVLQLLALADRDHAFLIHPSVQAACSVSSSASRTWCRWRRCRARSTYPTIQTRRSPMLSPNTSGAGSRSTSKVTHCSRC